MARLHALGFGFVLMALTAASAPAQTIYPLDRAEILAGSKFDLKVEFPGSPAQGAVKVTINGQDAAGMLGQAVKYVDKEDGQDYAAYYVREAALAQPGRYTVEASEGTRKSTVTWEV